MMSAKICKEEIFCLLPRLNMNQALSNAGSIMVSSFGLEGMIYRLKAEEIKITKNQLYYEPFWHIDCDIRYEYDRVCSHDVTTIAPEVHHLTIDNNDYAVVESNPRKVTVSGIEHCTTSGSKDIIFDAEHGQEQDWKKYIGYQKETVVDDSSFIDKDGIFLPPKISSNALVHNVFLSLPRPIKADKIHEGMLNIKKLDLYFRPVYVFEYRWERRNKTAVAALDGITGKEISNGVTFHEKVKKIVTSDLLFDVSAEAANLIVPGSSIAFKFIKAYNDQQ